MNFSPEATHLIQRLLDLFARTNQVPLAFYACDPQGKLTEIAHSDERLFPSYCKGIWALDGGRAACNQDMQRRAGRLFQQGGRMQEKCHCGLTNVSQDITVNGKVVACIQYGAFLPEADGGSQFAIQDHQRVMTELRADAEQAARLETLMTASGLHRDRQEWQALSETLVPLLKEVIGNYIEQVERKRQIQELAYHELQVRHQEMLAHAELLELQAAEGTPLRADLEDLTGAIETSATVLTNMTGGEYLPAQYEFRLRSLRQLIRLSFRACRSEARKKQITLEEDLYPRNDPLYLPLSERHLRVAFINILHNAVKYSYRSKASLPKHRYIFVRGRYLERGGVNGYQVEVANYGVGIEPDELGLIFESGYRGRQALLEYRTGSGLGLPLALSIVRTHGGAIEVQSKALGEVVPDGSKPYLTRVFVWLPVAQPSH